MVVHMVVLAVVQGAGNGIWDMTRWACTFSSASEGAGVVALLVGAVRVGGEFDGRGDEHQLGRCDGGERDCFGVAALAAAVGAGAGGGAVKCGDAAGELQAQAQVVGGGGGLGGFGPRQRQHEVQGAVEIAPARRRPRVAVRDAVTADRSGQLGDCGAVRERRQPFGVALGGEPHRRTRPGGEMPRRGWRTPAPRCRVR